MKRLSIALLSVAFLASCGDGGDNSQNDPIDNTPPAGTSTAPTEQDPTPQTGSGGQSPAQTPSGTQSQ